MFFAVDAKPENAIRFLSPPPPLRSGIYWAGLEHRDEWRANLAEIFGRSAGKLSLTDLGCCKFFFIDHLYPPGRAYIYPIFTMSSNSAKISASMSRNSPPSKPTTPLRPGSRTSGRGQGLCIYISLPDKLPLCKPYVFTAEGEERHPQDYLHSAVGHQKSLLEESNLSHT